MLKRKNDLYLVAGIVLILIVLLMFFSVKEYCILDGRVVKTKLIVGSTPGFDLNKTALTFGRIQPSKSSKRSLFITNNFNKKARVLISSEGNISDFLEVSDNEFILNPGEKKKVVFVARAVEGSKFGEYKGEVKIILKRC